MSVLRTVVATLAASWRMGILLAGFAVMAVIGYHISGSDVPHRPADADAITVPPLVRAEPIGAPPPNVVSLAPEALTKPIAAPTFPQNRTSLVRELQKALARADCYRGAISGVWSEASKDAMRGFVQAVNAQLPVDNPDEALVALVESNDTATCSGGRAIYTGALKPPSPLKPPDTQSAVQSATAQQAPPAPAPDDNRSMIDRPWAAPEMLVPPKDMASTETKAIAPPPPPAPASVSMPPAPPSPPQPTQVVEVTPQAAAATPHADDPPVTAGARFENDKPLPDTSAVEPEPQKQDVAPAREKTAQKRPKSTKRKPKQQSDSSVSDTFYSIQKSISSMFE